MRIVLLFRNARANDERGSSVPASRVGEEEEDEPVKESHQVGRSLSRVVHELLTVLLPDCDQELVDRHGPATQLG